MSKFEIGENVLLNGKTYKIIGTIKRSFLLERNGKNYKATANMMGKIQNQNKMGIGVGKKRSRRSSTNHMERRLQYNRIWNKDAKMPETEAECMAWLDVICCELSPENLHCDGEISRSAAMKKYRDLMAEWKEVEKILGRKVTEDEVWQHVWTDRKNK